MGLELYTKRGSTYHRATEEEILREGAAIRGRRNKGNVKVLTPSKIHTIKRLRQQGMTLKDISVRESVSVVTVSKALKAA